MTALDRMSGKHLWTLDQVQQWFIYNFGLMGPGTRCFPYQWVQVQTYESRKLFLMTSLQYHASWDSLKLKLSIPETKLCAKDAGCTGKKITESRKSEIFWYFTLNEVLNFLWGSVNVYKHFKHEHTISQNLVPYVFFYSNFVTVVNMFEVDQYSPKNQISTVAFLLKLINKSGL